MTNPQGRPRKIKSPEEFNQKVDEYVAQETKAGRPILLTGMILHLGLHSRESFDEYRSYDGFSDSVTRAKMLIQSAYEKKLHDDPKSTNGSSMQFALKNMFGLHDRVDMNHGGQKDNPVVAISATMDAAEATRLYMDSMKR